MYIKCSVKSFDQYTKETLDFVFKPLRHTVVSYLLCLICDLWKRFNNYYHGLQYDNIGSTFRVDLRRICFFSSKIKYYFGRIMWSYPFQRDANWTNLNSSTIPFWDRSICLDRTVEAHEGDLGGSVLPEGQRQHQSVYRNIQLQRRIQWIITFWSIDNYTWNCIP